MVLGVESVSVRVEVGSRMTRAGFGNRLASDTNECAGAKCLGAGGGG